MLAFCLAQLVSSIIAGFGDWGFTNVHSISGGWIGIVWVWNIVWFFPMDLVKVRRVSPFPLLLFSI